jgi:hypothetical protein
MNYFNTTPSVQREAAPCNDFPFSTLESSPADAYAVRKIARLARTSPAQATLIAELLGLSPEVRHD